MYALAASLGEHLVGALQCSALRRRGGAQEGLPTNYKQLLDEEKAGSRTSLSLKCVAPVAAALLLIFLVSTDWYLTVVEYFAEWTEPTSDQTCKDGLFIPGPVPSRANVIFFMTLLLWSFIGVAIAADIFMVRGHKRGVVRH